MNDLPFTLGAAVPASKYRPLPTVFPVKSGSAMLALDADNCLEEEIPDDAGFADDSWVETITGVPSLYLDPDTVDTILFSAA